MSKSFPLESGASRPTPHSAVTFETPGDLSRHLMGVLGWESKVGYFPVRHHSPTCAKHLESWLETFRPAHVLIEGPQAYNDRIDIIADAEHAAPFALVATVRRKNEIVGRATYPMCDYSPELVALRWAAKNKAKARFIDLSHGERAADIGEPALDETIVATEDLAPLRDRHGATEEDSALARSTFTQRLIAESGCRDFDEVWESLFEQAGWSEEPLGWALSVAAYAYLSRAESTQSELVEDGTLEREQCMAGHIEEVAKSGKKVAVITGAFHTVALRTTKGGWQPARTRSLDVEVFLAPYTFPRLDALLGYASGMSGPHFYQLVWDARKKRDPFTLAAQEVLVEASRAARREGEVIGTADAIAALAFARQLATLRERRFVGRTDLIDAATSCLVKGDVELVGQRVLRAIAETMRGTAVGRLGPSAGEAPVVHDFRRRLRELRLPLEHGRPQPVELPIFASDLALERSRFFRQCRLLELPFAAWQRGPDLKAGVDLDLTIEHWLVQYVPEIEAKLTEISHLGGTIEDVAAAMLVKGMLQDEGKSGALAGHLLDALLTGLHREVERLMPKLASAMLGDDDALSLLAAASTLRNVLRGRARLEASRARGLVQLAKQAYVQGTLRLERLAQAPPDRAPDILDALTRLIEVLLTDRELTPPRDLAIEHARGGRDKARGRAPIVLGALDGFLLQLGASDVASIATNFVALRGRPDALGAYLEGVLALARHALLGDGLTAPPLLGALVDHVRGMEWSEFVSSLPALRRALTRLTPRETEAVAEQCATLVGVSRGDVAASLAASPEMVSKLGEWERAEVAAEERWSEVNHG